MPTNGDLIAAFDVAKKILEHSAFNPIVVDENAAEEMLKALAQKIVEHDASSAR